MSEVYDLKCMVLDFLREFHTAIKNEILHVGNVKLNEKLYQITKDAVEYIEKYETKYEKTLNGFKVQKKKKEAPEKHDEPAILDVQ
jgi:hypothetical protein